MFTFHRSSGIRLACAAAVLPWLACVGMVNAQPVTVTITQIEQIGDDFDPTSLGDFYAHVTINGATGSTFDDRFSFNSGYIVPSGWLVPPAPWVISTDVPITTPSVAVRIELFDDDEFTGNEEADLNPGPKNHIDIEVDLSTGKWSGDVTWPQSCISGPFDLSSRSAALCFDVSVLSASGDADGDGLLDGWELNGYNSDLDSTIDLDLPAMGADPLRKDVFVEVDCLVAGTHSHCPRQDSMSDAVAAFARAPVLNPDGTSGVQLHVDVGSLYGAGVVTPVPGPNGVVGTYGDFGGGGNPIPEAGREIIEAFNNSMSSGAKFRDLRASFFDSDRRGAIFRYAIFGHQTNYRRPANDCTSGIAEGIHAANFLVTLGGVNRAGDPCDTTDLNGFSVGSRASQAGTFMHEFGHTLGLRHGGLDDINKKPNFLSVMSYAFQDCRVPPSPDGTLPGGCDYSRVELPDLNETNLDECVGLDGGQLGFGPNDWDQDGLIEGATACTGFSGNVVADTNNDGTCVTPGNNETRDTEPAGDDVVSRDDINDGPNRFCNTAAVDDDEQETAVGGTPSQPAVLKSHDDWNNLAYSLVDLQREGAGGSDPVDDEPDRQMIEESRQYLSSLLQPNVELNHEGPATAVPGEVLTYIVKMMNTGRGPALGAVLTNTAPDGTTQREDVGAIVVGDTQTRTGSFTVPDDACPGDFTGAGASVAFSDIASNAMTATKSVPLEILDVAPPTLSVIVSPDSLWPPNHKFVPITAKITAEDNCDPDPAITLVSITSNEPEEDFIGEGDKAPDIADADFGTDDREFSLRSERGTNYPSLGRVYTIVYRATDVHGNAGEATATVTVPMSSGRP
jgi:uncharacterized repeat protein (TIGR01451 family)